jgi:plasmid maintenance system antidote protein VapI
MKQKRGGTLLRDWLRDERRTQEWLGAEIGTHQTNVSAWIRGRPIPLDMAVAIERLTGIDPKEWLSDAEQSGEHAAVSASRSA